MQTLRSGYEQLRALNTLNQLTGRQYKLWHRSGLLGRQQRREGRRGRRRKRGLLRLRLLLLLLLNFVIQIVRN